MFLNNGIEYFLKTLNFGGLTTYPLDEKSSFCSPPMSIILYYINF